MPFAALVFGGCLKPDGGLLELNDGEGEECEDLAPLTDVWTAGGGGRFIFWWGGAGLVAIAVAILFAHKGSSWKKIPTGPSLFHN